jgi:ATP-dependent DNA helicase RecG
MSIWDYPLDAIREALINAVCHRDYLISSNISVRIHDDRLEIWNPGGLAPNVTVEDLYKTHDSDTRNKGIAKVFFDIEFIEQWGSGIGKMVRLCKDAEVPVPVIKERQKGFQITFSKNIYTAEYLQKLGLNERQQSAIKNIKEKGVITLSNFKELHKEVSEKTLYRDLVDLVEKGILKESGTKKGRKYLLK